VDSARDRAKARIEELQSSLHWVIQERDDTFARMLRRAEEAEANLAKAVEALDMIGKHMVMSMAVDEGHLCRLMKARANATLAELKEDKS
jgi:predicted nucleic acid-binding OB-fold protein